MLKREARSWVRNSTGARPGSRGRRGRPRRRRRRPRAPAGARRRRSTSGRTSRCPTRRTEQAEHIFEPVALGAGSPRMITGVVVWGLIVWVVWRYRRRHDDEIPVQTRYNLPLEIFYTVAPVVMVVVFFYFTVETPERRPRGQPTRGPHDQRRRAAVVAGPSTTRGRGDRRRGHRRLRRPAPPATSRRSCLPVDETVAVQPALARRHPLLLGARRS